VLGLMLVRYLSADPLTLPYDPTSRWPPVSKRLLTWERPVWAKLVTRAPVRVLTCAMSPAVTPPTAVNDPPK